MVKANSIEGCKVSLLGKSHLFINSFINSFFYLFIYSSTSFPRLFIFLFIYLFIYLAILSFYCLFTYLLIYSKLLDEWCRCSLHNVGEPSQDRINGGKRYKNKLSTKVIKKTTKIITWILNNNILNIPSEHQTPGL